MEELINLVSNVGFPIAITAYLMMRFENKLEKLDDSINTANSMKVELYFSIHIIQLQRKAIKEPLDQSAGYIQIMRINLKSENKT